MLNFVTNLIKDYLLVMLMNLNKNLLVKYKIIKSISKIPRLKIKYYISIRYCKG